MGHATMLRPTTWLRGRTYWPRRVVPFDLRDRLGGLTQVRHSLRTKDYEEANRRWKIEPIKVDRLFEQARRGGAVMPTGLRRITEDDRDYYFDKLVADDQRERRLPDHVRRRYMAYMQDDGSRRCSQVLERWVRERQPPLKTEAERRKNFTRFIAIGRPEEPHSPSHACACRHVQEDHHGGEVGLLMGGQQRAHRGRESGSGDHRGERDGKRIGPRLPFDNGNAANYWLPLPGLYRGARLEELARWATSTR